MENAAKALLIAAAVLIGALLLANYNRTMKTTGDFTGSYMDKFSAREIADYNSDFVKYTGIDMNMYEVITLVNKSLAIDESCNFDKNTTDYITVRFVFRGGIGGAYEFNDFIGHYYNEDTGFDYNAYNEARFALLKAYYDDSISWEGRAVDEPKNDPPTKFRITKIGYTEKKVTQIVFTEQNS